jgi:cysteinyl-tRNA synthetase
MVNVGGEKMSKSLGNFTTIRALLESGTSPMTLRLFVLQAHYRKPLDFTAPALDAAATGWKGLNAALVLAHGLATNGPTPVPGGADQGGFDSADQPAGLSSQLSSARDRFAAALDDDLNTSAALAVLFELARPLRALANRIERGDQGAAHQAAQGEQINQSHLLLELAEVLGLKPETAAAAPDTAGGDLAPSSASGGPDDAQIQALIAQRLSAKKAKDFGSADRIRSELKSWGIELIDQPGGTTEWLRH